MVPALAQPDPRVQTRPLVATEQTPSRGRAQHRLGLETGTLATQAVARCLPPAAAEAAVTRHLRCRPGLEPTPLARRCRRRLGRRPNHQTHVHRRRSGRFAAPTTCRARRRAWSRRPSGLTVERPRGETERCHPGRGFPTWRAGVGGRVHPRAPRPGDNHMNTPQRSITQHSTAHREHATQRRRACCRHPTQRCQPRQRTSRSATRTL